MPKFFTWNISFMTGRTRQDIAPLGRKKILRRVSVGWIHKPHWMDALELINFLQRVSARKANAGHELQQWSATKFHQIIFCHFLINNITSRKFRNIFGLWLRLGSSNRTNSVSAALSETFNCFFRKQTNLKVLLIHWSHQQWTTRYLDRLWVYGSGNCCSWNRFATSILYFSKTISPKKPRFSSAFTVHWV